MLRTDRRTDRIAISISRVSVLTRDKNSQKCYPLWGIPIQPKSCMVGDVHDIIACVPSFKLKFLWVAILQRVEFLDGPYNSAALSVVVKWRHMCAVGKWRSQLASDIKKTA